LLDSLLVFNDSPLLVVSVLCADPLRISVPFECVVVAIDVSVADDEDVDEEEDDSLDLQTVEGDDDVSDADDDGAVCDG
jgi:hypothetical protein